MNKSELVEALSQKKNLTYKKAEQIVNLIFDSMSQSLVDRDRIEIRGFGSFMVKDYKSYLGRNPKTGEIIKVEEKKLPFFKAGKGLRERVDR
ncbi:HU family DNA-binding protein [Pelovirga terrestris]|uniref:Integration host factor subunit beta n=1 Tax=Pelovirga terrestris TaxID=2771352 RepID=A0A8J6QW30_9BACT|nr:HU family DNA-binding protein [Pelovirga terrestris]MBD1399288.1 integration host factor subunit beta [Pelovirga terrestris]